MINNLNTISHKVIFGENKSHQSDCFTNCFHEFFSVRVVEQENKFLIDPKQICFLSLPVENKTKHNQYPSKKC